MVDMPESYDHGGVWLQVDNVRLTGRRIAGSQSDKEPAKTVSVTVVGDRAYPQPVWWPLDPTLGGDDLTGLYREFSQALGRSGSVLVRLSPSDSELTVQDYRIEFNSGSR